MRRVYAIAIISVFGIYHAVATEQPPYEIEDRAISENMRVIYYGLDQHRHNGEDSSKLFDVIPASSSRYNLGGSTTTWQFTFSLQVALGNYTTAQIRTLTPATTGAIIYNREGLDLWVSTGISTGQWRNVRTGAAP